MKKHYFLNLFFIGILFSCNKGEQQRRTQFDPSQPIEITSFFPDSGGIATPILIDGRNFGSDTVGLRVLFVDEFGVKHRAGLVSSNGSKIYAFVPRLTNLREMEIQVERILADGRAVLGRSAHPFFYKTQTAVTTIVGQPGTQQQNTVGGSFGSATLSAPMAIVLDNEDNIFIVERGFSGQGSSTGQPGDASGTRVGSNFVIADQKLQEVRVLRYNADTSNAPTFSGIEGNEAVYIPTDGGGVTYFQLPKVLGYSPRDLRLITDANSQRAFANQNWKYSFVANTADDMVYTVIWNGHLVRFDPRTRDAEIVADNILPGNPGEPALTNARGERGSNIYLAFCPINPFMLYMCMEDYNLIARIDVSPAALASQDPALYKPEWYAGRSIIDGPVPGRGWEDGLLENARFFAPKQIAFTADGKLYIADTQNHCIRVIDTTVPRALATVSTAIGLPETPGFRDGGPEVARFDLPSGVAVSADGTVIYIADANNKVIRKLSIE
jgi:hypothetical protein